MIDNRFKWVYIVGQDKQVEKLFTGYTICTQQKFADIVVFIGGNDVCPSLYKQQANPLAGVIVDRLSDIRDTKAYESCTPNQMKVGICRGGQFLHVMNGGTLYQDVDCHHRHHKIFNTLDSTEHTVNSSHHQMMKANEESVVLAYSENQSTYVMDYEKRLPKPDYEPEAIWYPRTKSFCFQPHPEWGHKETTDLFWGLMEKIK